MNIIKRHQIRQDIMGFFDLNDDDDNNVNRESNENKNDGKPAYSPVTYKMANPTMANWSNTLGIIALATSPCILPSLIVGPIAIILGLLSRGGQDNLPPRAKMGVILGAVGLVAGIGIFAYEYYSLIQMYGSMEGIMEEYIRILNSYQ